MIGCFIRESEESHVDVDSKRRVRDGQGSRGLALGGAILWQVVEHCGPAKGIAYVHVVKTQVNVTVDEETYWVETLWDSPIVCELRRAATFCGCFRADVCLMNRNSRSTRARKLS